MLAFHPLHLHPCIGLKIKSQLKYRQTGWQGVQGFKAPGGQEKRLSKGSRKGKCFPCFLSGRKTEAEEKAHPARLGVLWKNRFENTGAEKEQVIYTACHKYVPKYGITV